MTSIASTTDFTTGAVLSWALPIAVVFVVLVWWAGVLAVRALRTRQGSGN